MTTPDAPDHAPDEVRRWYALVTPQDLHPREGRLVSDVVLEVLREVVDRVEIDAYSDYADELGPAEVQAEQAIRALGSASPGRMGDPFMAVGLRLDEPQHRELVRTYAAWSIHMETWSDQLGRDLATFHDSSWSITLKLTDLEAAVVRQQLSHLGGLELLRDVHRERRARRRTAAAAAVRRLLRR